jgi:ABC-2 type transport system ATP-binding protein
VVVRTPEVARLGGLLVAQGASVDNSQPELLMVTGMTADAIGDVAFDHGVRLHELSNKVATLEEAFLERTAGAEEFQAYNPSATGDGVAS